MAHWQSTVAHKHVQFTMSNNQPPAAQTASSSQSNSISQMGDVRDLVAQSHRIPFLGLSTTTNSEYPDHTDVTSPFYADSPHTFHDVIGNLPAAEKGELYARNEYVLADGTVDTAAIAAVDGLDMSKLPVDPDTVSSAQEYEHASRHADIIDPRRKALSALGYDCEFRWQVATNSYAIINPRDAYLPAYETFEENGSENTIFGWADIDDWGGTVDMYILFTDHTIDHPDDTTTDGSIYIGLHTGYDFQGGRAMDVKLFGYDTANDVRFYSLGERQSRRHVGDPNNPAHERQNGRTPIKEWWENEHDNLIAWTDDLVVDIEEATKMTLDFSEGWFADRDFSIKNFYEYLDIPDTYIQDTDGGRGAVRRAERHSPSDTTYTPWTLFYALASTLEAEFQGDDHTGSAFNVYADIATNILRSPGELITRAKDEYEYQNQSSPSQTPSDLQAQITDSATDIDGVETEDKLDLVDKREIAKQTQQKLLDYRSDN